MNTAGRLLWVDDDRATAERYVARARQAGFEVTYCDNIDIAVQAIEKARAFDLVVWDMAMPPGDTFATMPSQGGFQTGRLFHDLVKKRLPGAATLLFTNFKVFVRDFSAPDRNEYALTKRDFAPSHLVLQLQQIVRPAHV